METLGSEDPGYRRSELREELELALAQLDPVARSAVRLRVEEDLPVAEVARHLCISPARAAHVLKASLRTLRAVLEPAGGPARVPTSYAA
jgi:RNA polymerase sigma factor (sigma-70 family)